MGTAVVQIVSQLGSGVQGLIYGVATAMLYPVLVMEVVALGWVFFESGRFAYASVVRFRARRNTELEDLVSDITVAESPSALAELVAQVSPSAVVARATATLASGAHADRIQRAKAMSDAEALAGSQLDRMRSLVRIGPILGLMGTLIPISPALVGLAQGDVATLSNNLVIAFSSTVVGLLISGVAYVVSLAQSRQFEEDLSAIAYLFDRMGD